MWQDYASAIGLGLTLSVLAFGVARVSLIMGERSIERRFGRVGLKKMMVERARLEQKLEARRNARMAEIQKVDAEVKQLFLRRQRLDRSLTDAKAASERLVRLIGEEIEGTPCYVAKVINRYIGAGEVKQQGSILLDRTWAQPQEMEVWTRTAVDARTEIERRYPPAFGFHITRLNELGVQEEKVRS